MDVDIMPGKTYVPQILVGHYQDPEGLSDLSPFAQGGELGAVGSVSSSICTECGSGIRKWSWRYLREQKDKELDKAVCPQSYLQDEQPPGG